MIYVLLLLITLFVAGLGYYFLKKIKSPPFKPSPQATTQLKGFYINIEEFKVYVEQSGSGPDMICLHGIGASLNIWNRLTPMLSSQFRVTSIDLPGFGQSDKLPNVNYDLDSQTSRLIEIFEKINISQALVVGSSMGGAIALHLAKLRPSLVSHLVLISPATHPKLIPSYLLHLTPLSKIFYQNLNPFVMRQILKRVIAKHDLIDDDLIEAYLSPYKNKPESIVTFLKSLSLIGDVRLPTLFHDVRTPTLILWGAKDQQVKEKYMHELVKVLENSTLVAHPWAGHHLMEDDPDWILHQVLDFFLRLKS